MSLDYSRDRMKLQRKSSDYTYNSQLRSKGPRHTYKVKEIDIRLEKRGEKDNRQ